MFKSAKIKLTAWYLLIIMTVSISFSAVMYTGVSAITKRALDNQRLRIERRIMDMEMYRPTPRIALFVDEGALIEVRERTLGILFVINLFIFVIAGGMGYILAGLTLKPIEDMLIKQRRFISDAAHELKTPITAMKTDMEVTLRDKEPTVDKQRISLKNAIEETDKLNLFVNNLLKKSRYELGNHQSEPEILDFASIVAEVIKTMSPLAKQKNIALEDSIEKINVKARESELNELVMNLIDNSIKYSNENGIVKIKVITQGKNVVLTVQDNGIGISEKDLKNIFEPFYKVDKSRTKTKANGYGLGLAIVKDIVNSNHGSIDISSKINEGTTFTVILPIVSESTQVSLSKQI
ncbi:HAMP domain-containing histidine kinase [candidate division WWE3 bacterium]|uniref:histidine kinase n=1 Tax=candidate division WWE3 bacterium TaxID=2053526 RepID=A0A7X9DKQ9_UNCKA|nr:HAMP domain-containing histidine kinase [candidate division WWE3 bacterium]